MCFRSPKTQRARCLLVVTLAAIACAGCAYRPVAPTAATEQPARRVIHIAADPNNLPFSNDRLEGFENKIAQVIAKDLDADVQYVWRAQRRGFFRHAFKEDGCEVVLGVPAHFDMAATTAPYYRSTYVFVSRKDRALDIRSFDDPALRDLKIGIHVLGDADEGSGTPAGFALARRGLADNIVGYTIYGDYREPNPPARIIDAVAAGEVDVAVVWGPLAGYFAKVSKVPLEVVPVSSAVEPPGVRFAFDISVGVKKGDTTLKDELNGVLARRHAEIEAILDAYGVPRAAPESSAQTASVR
jgi:quinoprotein dehydrogenase-associated probable ABC transporter substrate-binding protein